MQPIHANEATFTKISKSRKTAPYKTALEIARLIILNFAPNVSSGKENMLALLFDMNSFWEEYVLVCLKKAVKQRFKCRCSWSKITTFLEWDYDSSRYSY